VEGTSKTNSRFLVSVSLSGPSATDVTVDFATADGTAISGSTGRDFVATAGTLRIAAGATSGSIAVDVIADSSIEADETFLLSLANPTGASIADGQALITIANDDTTTAATTTTKGNNGQGNGTALGLVDRAQPDVVPPFDGSGIDPITGFQAAVLASPEGDSLLLICDELLPEDAPMAWNTAPLPALVGTPCGFVVVQQDPLQGLFAAVPPWLQPAALPSSLL